MNMPGYTAECSLYKSIRGYAAAPNHTAVEGGAIVPALMQKLCWDKTSSNTNIGIFGFHNECQICQWFVYTRICPRPPACQWGWVPAGPATQECTTELTEIRY